MINIRHCLADLHPDLSLVRDAEEIDRLFLWMWGARYPGYAGPPPMALADDVKSIWVNDAFQDVASPGPVGLAVCTWNRPLYLEQCLDSIRRCDLDGVTTILVDDASGDAETLGLIKEFDIDAPLIKIHKLRRRQIHHSLDLAWCLLKCIGCRFLSNLDADAIVAPSWLSALQCLHRKIESPDKAILSPFNKHPDASLIKETDDHVLKRRLGGISYFFSVGLLPSIRPLLIDIVWDSLVSGYFANRHADGYRLVCTRPSYVQHIGAIGMNSGPFKEFDRAADFVEGEPPPGRGRE